MNSYTFVVEIPRPDHMVPIATLESERAMRLAVAKRRSNPELLETLCATLGTLDQPASIDTLRRMLRRPPAYLGVSGHPTERVAAHSFVVRTPSIRDEIEISSRVCALAAELSGGDVGYADWLAERDILTEALRAEVTDYALPDREYPEAQLTGDELDAVQDVINDVTRLAAREPILRRAAVLVREIGGLSERIDAVESQARWWVLSEPRCELEEIPGWPVYGGAVLRAWDKAEAEYRVGFTLPSATSVVEGSAGASESP